MSARSTLGSFIGFAGAALRPLADELATPAGVLALLADVGVVVDDAPAAAIALGPKAEAVRSAHDALLAADDAGEFPAALALSGAVAELTAALITLGPALVDELGTTPEQPARVDAGRRLLDHLLVDAVAIERPRLSAALRLGGILDVSDDPTPPPPGPLGTPDYPVDLDAWSSLDPSDDPENYVRPVPDWDEPAIEFPVTRRRTIRTDRLHGLLEDPAGVPGDVFEWASASFDGSAVLQRLEELLRASGLTTTLGARIDLEAVAPPDGPPPAAEVLDVPVYAAGAEYGTVEFGLVLAPLGPSAFGGADAGVALTPRAGGATEFDFPLSATTALVLSGDMDLSGTVRIAFRPGGARLELDPYGDGDGVLSGAPTATLRYSPAGGLVLLAQAGLVTVTVDALALTLGLEDHGAGLVPSVGAALEGGRLELAPGDADGFLRSVLPSASAPFEFGLTWTPDGGFQLQGGSGLAVILPIDANLGPVRLDALAVAVTADGTDGLALTATLTAAVTLGPLVATVEGIGLDAAARVAEAGGNLGPLQLDPLRFVPPTGLGLAVEVEDAASGGGFLALDADEGRYSGAAELEILGVGLEAAGVLLTKLPAGGEAWSLFLSLSARFTGLQLGFGFTLNGVGGLVGVNRGVDEDALGAAVRSGALNAVLFPEDPIADAPIILDSIESVFPPIGGQYVIGPVVNIGWGTPTLVEIDAGVAIQLPQPLAVSLLGALSAVLPAGGRADPGPARRHRGHREPHRGHAQPRRLADGLACRRSAAHRRHGRARVAAGRADPPGRVRRLPSRVHAARRLPRSRRCERRARHRRHAPDRPGRLLRVGLKLRPGRRPRRPLGRRGGLHGRGRHALRRAAGPRSLRVRDPPADVGLGHRRRCRAARSPPQGQAERTQPVASIGRRGVPSARDCASASSSTRASARRPTMGRPSGPMWASWSVTRWTSPTHGQRCLRPARIPSLWPTRETSSPCTRPGAFRCCSMSSRWTRSLTVTEPPSSLAPASWTSREWASTSMMSRTFPTGLPAPSSSRWTTRRGSRRRRSRC